MAPRNITPGTEWGAEIVNAIGTSKVLVLIFSAAANQSPKVLREVERAVAKNIVIIPFRIEDIIPTKSMEYFLSATHWLNAFQGRPENHFATLIKTVTQQLSLSPPVSTNPSGGYNRKHYLPYLVPAVVLLLIAAASGTLLFHKTDSRQRSTQNRITNGIAAKKVLQLNPSMVPEKTHVTPRTNVHPVVPPAAPSVAPIPLQTGDYLRFGKYYDAPILWRVVRVQNGTALLISTHILTLKPFDAAESGSYDHNGAGLVFDENKPWNEVVTAYTAADLRKMKGSNNWISANIREWLNSSSAPVRYSTQPPTQQAVAGGANSYASEPGFLYYFTPAERNL
ncbi:MAG TPA: toll/interleukin-1 receptor domain-containing protein, partial [Bacillota bacterium]|nr:toll/interleukin-1 receptor domain-containing protein [Bacillota bacterium]